MPSQKDVFVESEADQWFRRNVTSRREDSSDELGVLLQQIEIKPQKLLEVGCSDGFRLQQLRMRFGCECHGIDPSAAAIAAGVERYPGILLAKGTADLLDYPDESFDTIVFGFCLYLCDRGDLFRIAAEADRCLQPGGTLVVVDFMPPFPYKNSYSHRDGLYSYKMDYSRIFSWNPAFVEVARLVSSHDGFRLRDEPDERIGTVVLRKAEKCPYPGNPFAKRSDG